MKSNYERALRTTVAKQQRRAEMSGIERTLRRALLRRQTGCGGGLVLRRVPLVDQNVLRQAVALARDIRTQPFRRPTRPALVKV